MSPQTLAAIQGGDPLHPSTTAGTNYQGFAVDLVSCANQVIDHYADAGAQSPSEAANFAKTPYRVAKAWPVVYGTELQSVASASEIVNARTRNVTPKKDLHETVSAVLATGFPMENVDEDTGIVTQGPIKAEGTCPHHLMPVHYEAYVSYLPKKGGLVLGLSKLARLVTILATRPVLQEQVAVDIVDALHKPLDPNVPVRDIIPQLATDGAAVQLIGTHTCMSCRGIKSNAKTLSTVLRGAYKNSSLTDEFYRAVDTLEKHKV